MLWVKFYSKLMFENLEASQTKTGMKDKKE